jgi:hypothetical protein
VLQVPLFWEESTDYVSLQDLLGYPDSLPNNVKAIVTSIFHQAAIRKITYAALGITVSINFLADTESVKS